MAKRNNISKPSIVRISNTTWYRFTNILPYLGEKFALERIVGAHTSNNDVWKSNIVKDFLRSIHVRKFTRRTSIITFCENAVFFRKEKSRCATIGQRDNKQIFSIVSKFPKYPFSTAVHNKLVSESGYYRCFFNYNFCFGIKLIFLKIEGKCVFLISKMYYMLIFHKYRLMSFLISLILSQA